MAHQNKLPKNRSEPENLEEKVNSSGLQGQVRSLARHIAKSKEADNQEIYNNEGKTWKPDTEATKRLAK